jgi:hypothetical protein
MAVTEQVDDKLIEWPPQACDMNPIEIMWSEVEKTMQATWPDLPLRHRNALWTLESDTWDEVGLCQHYVQSLVEPMSRQMMFVFEA